MAKFDLYFPKLMQLEGGFVNDPDDAGGATNKGVTLRIFNFYAKKYKWEEGIEALKTVGDDKIGSHL